MDRRPVTLIAMMTLLSATLAAAELDPRTLAAFDRYVKVTKTRMDEELQPGRNFLRLDGQPEETRRSRLDLLKGGQVVIDRLETREGGATIDVPKGLIHHWVGVAFIPGVKVDRAVSLMQDYDHHAEIFRPAVVGSRLLAREGDTFHVYLRFFMKKVISVTMNTENEARFVRPAPDRVYSEIVSTRVAEVEHAGTPGETEKPAGQDSGYMWRLNTYWRYLERDGGTYIQCESITLSRDIPFGLGWIVGPFVTSIPRESLTFTLARLRSQLSQPAPPPKAGNR